MIFSNCCPPPLLELSTAISRTPLLSVPENHKTIIFIIKLHLLNSAHPVDDEAGTERLLTHTVKLREKYLKNSNKKINDKFTKIDFMATILVLKCELDKCYNLKTYSEFSRIVNSDRQKSIRNNAGWNEEIDKTLKTHTYSLAELKKFEIEFLDTINWDLGLCSNFGEASPT